MMMCKCKHGNVQFLLRNNDGLILIVRRLPMDILQLSDLVQDSKFLGPRNE